MAANPIIRTHFTFTELMAHWQCSENDLRDAIVSQRLVPSIHVKAAVWEMALDSAGKRARRAPALYVNELMYLVGVESFGAFDCAFNYFSREPGPLEAGSLFKPDGSAYLDIRTRLSDVERDGRFTVEAIDNAKALYGSLTIAQSPHGSSAKTQWWNSDFDVLAIAKEIEKQAEGREWGLNQSGARAQRYPLSRISDAVAKKIEDADTVAGKGRRINGKSISNYLKSKGWT